MQPLIKADSQLLRLKHPPKWTHKCYLFSMNGQMDKVTLYVHLGAVFSCREKWWTLQNQRFAVEQVGVVRKREKRRKDETAQKYVETYVKSQCIFQEFINHPYTSLCILYSFFFSFPSALEGISALITPSLPSSGSQGVLFVPPSTPECNLWSICVQVFVGTACRKGVFTLHKRATV